MRFWYQLKCCAASPTLKFMFPQLGLLITVFERWSMGSNKRAGSWNFNSRPRYGFQDRLPSIYARRTCKVALTTLSLSLLITAAQGRSMTFGFLSHLAFVFALPRSRHFSASKKLHKRNSEKLANGIDFSVRRRSRRGFLRPHNVSRQIAAILLSLSQVISILRHFDSDVFVFRLRRPSAVVMDRFYLRCAQSREMELNSALIGWLLLAVCTSHRTTCYYVAEALTRFHHF